MKEYIYYDLCQIVGVAHVLRDESMSRHTTFRVGGPAQLLVTPDGESLPEVIAYCRKKEIPCLVIGNGSNLLCGDGGVDGVVVEIGKRMSGIRMEENAESATSAQPAAAADGTVTSANNPAAVTVTAEAGALLSAVAARAAAESLTGFEFAAGIPGSVGGAVVMNAGAYGGEMVDVLSEVTVLTPENEIRTIPAGELGLSYRHSVIPERGYIVLSAALHLIQGDPARIQARMEELKEKRVTKQPLEYPSAGSTFRRPEGYFAGKLIEDAGLRGFTVGGAQVSEKHCGFVINRGGATAADIRSLMEQVQHSVRNQFGVTLEPEVKFVGKF
ncbi:MAG: UDP-N-acetylmuramate dehydrogenase [Clostridiales bacterium]|nr:UDP-N-acetylmuramate dehydrogenase [Clostridiales bacterium]